MSRKPLTRILTAIGVVFGLLSTLVVAGGLSADAEANPHPDYLLNIIGVDKGKKADLEDSKRRTIFVDLHGPSKINLQPGDFEVIDGNATKGSPALFQLPDPDVDGDGVLDGTYSISARPLGTPGGKVDIYTCADLVDGDLEDLLSGKNRKSVLDDSAYCTLDDYAVHLERGKGKPQWGDVTDELLSIAFELNIYDEFGEIIGTEIITVPIFDDALENEFWEYNNDGMRLLQLRFTLND